MISKAKILFYGLFRRPKNVPITKTKKLTFLNKLVLLQVRRFKGFKDIPATVSIFDWQESKRRAWKHYKIAGLCLLAYLFFDLTRFWKYRRLVVSQQLYEERRKKNLAERPLYDPFGENPEFDQYDTEFVWRRIEEHNRVGNS